MGQCLWFFWIVPFYQFYCTVPFVEGERPILVKKNRTRIDPDWSQVIERFEINYDETGGFPAREAATESYSYRNRWDLAGHLEIPYYAILYTNITEVNPSGRFTSHVSTHPGSACGGILVNQKQEYVIFRYTMFSKTFPAGVDKDHFIPTIYMSHSQVFFAPDFSHIVDNDPNKHSATWLNCSAWETLRLHPRDLIYGLALANFYPEIQDLDLNSYIPWPPVPIANVTRYNRLQPVSFYSVAAYPNVGIRARVVGMGFVGEGEFFDDLDGTINVHDSLADAEAEVVALDECQKKFPHLNQMQSYLKIYVVCLKGVVDYEGYFSIKNGLPGNPVLTGFGSLAGMIVDSDSSSPKEHYYLMLNFISVLQYKIENENNGYLLQRQKIVRAPLYREGGWEKVFLQYTVPANEEKSATDPQPLSAAPATLPERPNIQKFSMLLLSLSTLL